MFARLRTRAVEALDPGRLIRPIGTLIALVGVAVLLTALQVAIGRGEPNFGLLVGAAGMALLIAGAFMAGRRRPDLVAALLGSMTAASFAVAIAAVSSAPPRENAEQAFASFQPSLVFAAVLFAFLAVRSGFERAEEGS